MGHILSWPVHTCQPTAPLLDRHEKAIINPRGVYIHSGGYSEVCLCFPSNLLLAGDGAGCKCGCGEVAVPFCDFVNAKLGGATNYNLKHVN